MAMHCWICCSLFIVPFCYCPAKFDSTLNIIKLCIIVHHKIQFFCFASAQKNEKYIYIYIHSINKCLVKEQVLSDTHTYGIS